MQAVVRYTDNMQEGEVVAKFPSGSRDPLDTLEILARELFHNPYMPKSGKYWGDARTGHTLQLERR